MIRHGITAARNVVSCSTLNALGSPSGTLDSEQNVRFPPVEGRVVRARSNSNGPISVKYEATLRTPQPMFLTSSYFALLS